MREPFAQCKCFLAIQRGHPVASRNESRDLLQNLQRAVTHHGTQDVVTLDETLPGILKQLNIKPFNAELDKKMRAHAAQHEAGLTSDQISLLHFAQGKRLIAACRIMLKSCRWRRIFQQCCGKGM